MRHRKKQIILDRKRAPRIALIRSLVRAFIIHGKIDTTDARGRAVRSVTERLITLAKDQSLHHRRMIIQRTGSVDVANRIIEKIAPRYKERHGGYTRRYKINSRQGDRASMVRIELI